MPHVIFLPGAMGAPGFWEPVADRLPKDWAKVLLGWPGLGDQPHDPSVRKLDDLVRLVEAQLSERTDLVAQSLGGVIAIRVAARHPDQIRRLVLTVTSGATGITAPAAEDWRREYRHTYPNAAEWVTAAIPDLTPLLVTIQARTLLLFGDADPIAPVATGERLAGLLPNATLHVVPGGTHVLAVERAGEVAPIIAEHLT